MYNTSWKNDDFNAFNVLTPVAACLEGCNTVDVDEAEDVR
jgi:hypothetical protein